MKRRICFWSVLMVLCFGVGICLGVYREAACRDRKTYRIWVGEPGSNKYLTFQLKDPEMDGCKQIRMQNEEFVLSGILDLERYYFEGVLAWNQKDYYVYDYDSGEYRQLEEKLNSFLLGDYYVHCEYREKRKEMALLIIYRPKEEAFAENLLARSLGKYYTVNVTSS